MDFFGVGMKGNPVNSCYISRYCGDEKEMNWRVYIILCSDNTLYTGITTDLQRRFGQHASGRGARYFRGRRPVQVVYQESGHTRSTASTREAEIKTLARDGKRTLICSGLNEITTRKNNDKTTSPPADNRTAHP